jgi:ribonucleoside-diphosphate reductase alpha chain
MEMGGGAAPTPLNQYQIIRRNGAVVPFEPNKIAVAMMKAFLAVHGTQGAASASVREVVDGLTQAVIRALVRSRPGGGTFHIEDVQDHVELGLMRGGHHEIARAYVLYREKRAQERARKQEDAAPKAPALHVLDGERRVVLDMAWLKGLIDSACEGLGADIRPEPILAETLRNLYDGVPMDEVYKASVLAARTLIEKDPDYTYATARLLFHTIAKEVLGRDVPQVGMGQAYVEYFPQFIRKGVDNELLDVGSLDMDLARTWYLWPMSAAAQTRFLRGYEQWRSPRTFLLYEVFWAVHTLACAAAYLQRSRQPVGELPRALERLAGGELPRRWVGTADAVARRSSEPVRLQSKS